MQQVFIKIFAMIMEHMKFSKFVEIKKCLETKIIPFFNLIFISYKNGRYAVREIDIKTDNFTSAYGNYEVG